MADRNDKAGISRQVLKEELQEFSATVLQTALDRTRDELKSVVASAVSEAVEKIRPHRQADSWEPQSLPPMHSWMRQKPMRHGESGASGAKTTKDVASGVGSAVLAKTLRASILHEQAKEERRMMTLDSRVEVADSPPGTERSYAPLMGGHGAAFRPGMAERLRAAVRGATFEQIAACIVLGNALVIGLETPFLNPKEEEKGLKNPAMKYFHWSETAFCIVFTIELLLRVFTYGRDFLFGDGWQWNVFDLTIVILQVTEQISKACGGARLSYSTVNLLRLLRIFRIARLLRVLRLVDELQRIIVSIVNSLSSLGWVLMLLSVLVYFFSVLFTQMTLVHVEASDPQFDHLMHFFGSIPKTGLTLFESVFGGLSWDEPARLLLDCISPFACVIFCFYIAFCLIALMNVVTGVFVDKAMRSANAAEEQTLCNQVTNIFFDEDHPDRQISWETFQGKMEHEDMADYFRAIDIDATEAKNLFVLLDTDNSGGVDCSELVNGLLRLRGHAGALEVSLMMREMSYMFDRIQQMMIETLPQ
eukprot:TRINITY_DN5673_c0_g1_i1.p1 TRINITY_DN5673_c0_g1~~TRINITY_DN5673_c0_g1_i1.p1  ORF type:complete len:553 (+),score=120.51 TRINITY_DN5673_c0_g1_i1:62-1660(+)